MKQPFRITVNPRRPRKLAAEDLYRVWWLNLRSLERLDASRSAVPHLWLEDDGERLRLSLETVYGAEPPLWTSPAAIDHALALEARLAEAGDGPAGFDPGLVPATPISLRLRWALHRALEDYALRRVPGCPPAGMFGTTDSWTVNCLG